MISVTAEVIFVTFLVADISLFVVAEIIFKEDVITSSLLRTEMPYYIFLAAILSVCYRNNWACDVSWDFLSNDGTISKMVLLSSLTLKILV